MSKITFTRDQARYFADAALSAVSNDDMTPVICGALVSSEDGKIRVVCTDRYRAHTALVEVDGSDLDFGFIIPREALLWLKKNLGYFGSFQRDQQRVLVSVEPHPEGNVQSGVLTVSVHEFADDKAASVSWNGSHIKGNFPPVIKLIETAREAEAVLAAPRLRLDFVGMMSRLAQFGQQESARMKTTPSSNPNKPGAVYFSWSVGGQIYAEAIIQPNTEVN